MDVYRLPNPNSPVRSSDILLQSLQAKMPLFLPQGISPDSARTDAKTVIDHAEFGTFHLRKARREMSQNDDRINLGTYGHNIYGSGIAACVRLDSLGQQDRQPLDLAFRYAENDKASAFMLQLQDRRAKSIAGIPDTVLELERSLKSQINAHEEQLLKLTNPQNRLDSTRKTNLQEALFALSKQLDSLNTVLEEKYPRYIQLKYETYIASVEEVQQRLLAPHPGSALLEYFVADSQVYIFCITETQYRVIPVAYPLEELRQAVRRFRYGIIANTGGRDLRKHVRYLKYGTQLYQRLFKPVEDLLSVKRLYIVPDGPLWKVPFEALPAFEPDEAELARLEQAYLKSGDSVYTELPYLLHSYSIRYAMNASFLIQQQDDAAQRTKPEHELLAFAPIFPRKEDQQLITQIETDTLLAMRRFDDEFFEKLDKRGLPPLPGTLKEVRKLALMVQAEGRQAEVYAYEQATEDRFKAAEVGKYRYIHLATHGFFDTEEPQLSGLVFHRDTADTTTEEDGALLLGETFNLPLNAELVTLSACETGQGDLRPGEGLVGLTRGLMYSGAQHVMVSYWPVTDASTAELMIDFYSRALKTEHSLSLLLQQAKRNMIEAGFAHPHYWSPFVLF